MKPFDATLSTELMSDASRLKGVEFSLIQRDEQQRIRLIQCGSRSLLPAESHYATIELEALAIVYAVEKCRQYLYGAEFVIVTDHRPLFGVFSKPPDVVDNARLQRFP